MQHFAACNYFVSIINLQDDLSYFDDDDDISSSDINEDEIKVSSMYLFILLLFLPIAKHENKTPYTV